jgi:hypothetical protein
LHYWLRFRILAFVICLPFSQTFPFFGADRAESASGSKLSATRTTVNVLLYYWLAYTFRPSESKFFEQIEAVLFVQVPAPVLLAYLPAYPLRQRPPA